MPEHPAGRTQRGRAHPPGGPPEETLDIAVGGRAWRITAVTDQDALLDSADDFEHFPFGLLLWDSAVGLARHFAGAPHLVAGRTVLELGCGVGLPGLVARAMGAAVCQTDHQGAALRLAEWNAAQNGSGPIERFAADWRAWTHRDRYDLLLGADITYNRPEHFHLEQIFRQNLAPGGSVLLSDPGRPQTLDFAAHLEKRGWSIAMDAVTVSPCRPADAAQETQVTIFTITRTPE
ncbi:MAG TPA: hypothetical protein VKT77_19780 [Chthonomonadaceae bacterium]|nr:hypothetical protein [Chthonomonadaceae bacterium]